MKICIIGLFAAIICLNTSCQKEYVCVCTRTQTGDKEYGDKIKANSFTKNANEKTCENTADLSLGTLKDCHLE